MRVALIVMLSAAFVVVGCSHMTPEQKEQARLAKIQAAEDKKARQQAEAEAKAEQKRLAEQAKADKKAADEQAREMKHQKATPAMQQTAMARANYYPDDRLKVIGYPDILPENHQTWLDKHAEAMATAGASTQATLYEADFAGNELSESGQNRLRLMMKDPPPTIYVATTPGNDQQKQARFAVITKFIQDSTGRQIAVKEGVNQDLSRPAAEGLGALQRLEKQTGAARPQNTSGGMSDSSPLDNRSITGSTTPNNP